MSITGKQRKCFNYVSIKKVLISWTEASGSITVWQLVWAGVLVILFDLLLFRGTSAKVFDPWSLITFLSFFENLLFNVCCKIKPVDIGCVYGTSLQELSFLCFTVWAHKKFIQIWSLLSNLPEYL